MRSLIRKPRPPWAAALLISKAQYSVPAEVARYGTTPARPMLMASLGTVSSAKVSLMTFCCWFFFKVSYELFCFVQSFAGRARDKLAAPCHA